MVISLLGKLKKPVQRRADAKSSSGGTAYSGGKGAGREDRTVQRNLMPNQAREGVARLGECEQSKKRSALLRTSLRETKLFLGRKNWPGASENWSVRGGGRRKKRGVGIIGSGSF